MQEKEKKEFTSTDADGNIWRLALEPQENYPARSDLNFYFNKKCFHLQFFSRMKDANNLWELLELSANTPTKENE